MYTIEKERVYQKARNNYTKLNKAYLAARAESYSVWYREVSADTTHTAWYSGTPAIHEARAKAARANALAAKARATAREAHWLLYREDPFPDGLREKIMGTQACEYFEHANVSP